jgi:hypothetical protein
MARPHYVVSVGGLDTSGGMTVSGVRQAATIDMLEVSDRLCPDKMWLRRLTREPGVASLASLLTFQ